MVELINPNDPYQMNWIEGDTPWGTVRVPKGISVRTVSERHGDTIQERYVFTNDTQWTIFTELTDIAIYATFNDDYVGTPLCMVNRCHAHIWCGENCSYVMGLRMGGAAPHLGLVLTEGSLSGYSVERDASKNSSDRGDFLLHPAPVVLMPNESFAIGWTLFWHSGKENFYKKITRYAPRFIMVSAEQYVVFSGEPIRISITPGISAMAEHVSVTRNGDPVPFILADGCIQIQETARQPGELRYDICADGVKTHCSLLVMPELEELVRARCRYIAEKQQYHNPQDSLDGAYLVYDTEEEHLFYDHADANCNSGRERLGMGILLARYLQTHKDPAIEESLKKYVAFVERELFDPKTGMVYNDCCRELGRNRMYNYPWVSVLYVELYRLYGRREHALYAYRALRAYYNQNGDYFYGNEIPLYALLDCLKQAGMTEQWQETLAWMERHCQYILSVGSNYPAHEVKYEQSIVAPAAYIMLQAYAVTRKPEYLEGAREHLKNLELFNGEQPDYHLYEVAIRHWDGYWFGKRKLLGDTFPHYWSALTGNVYALYAELTGETDYAVKAEKSFRGVLSLFFADGSASCAYLYPVSVNGKLTRCFDPYANDQDWGLYDLLRYLDGLHG